MLYVPFCTNKFEKQNFRRKVAISFGNRTSSKVSRQIVSLVNLVEDFFFIVLGGSHVAVGTLLEHSCCAFLHDTVSTECKSWSRVPITRSRHVNNHSPHVTSCQYFNFYTLSVEALQPDVTALSMYHSTYIWCNIAFSRSIVYVLQNQYCT